MIFSSLSLRSAQIKGDSVKVECFSEKADIGASPNTARFQLPASSPIALPVYYTCSETEVNH